MGRRKSHLGGLCPLLAWVLLCLPDASSGVEERKRAFEVYSSALFDEELGDFTGVELELFLWDGAAEATLTVHGRGDPVKLRGAAKGHEVFVSVTDGKFVLELSGARRKKKFDGTLLLKQQGNVVWTEDLKIPRRRPGKT